ncbi:glycosyltransferase family 2 protein [Pseudooceanicola sp. 502str34]
MAPTELKLIETGRGAAQLHSFSRRLITEGGLTASDVIRVRQKLTWQRSDFQTLLLRETALPETKLLEITAAHYGLTLWRPDSGCVTDLPELPVRLCLKHCFMPYLETEGALVLVTPDPDRLLRMGCDLPASCRSLPLRIGARQAIREALSRHHRGALTDAMSTRTPAELSCRTWQDKGRRRKFYAIGMPAVLLAGLGILPGALFTALTVWALFTLVLAAGLRASALIAWAIAARRAPDDPLLNCDPALTAVPQDAKLPMISILVPLFREAMIAETLLIRLQKLDYPRGLLEIVLVLEEDDTLTRETAARTALPPWFRQVVVPRGSPQTKPRAMNYALDFCEGEIIGIYDAEDAPDPDQLMKVALHFQAAAPQVACLQGALDYYNPRQNWMARCFTIEYATWFRLILPGFARLGLGLPLGGTTLFIRRQVLEEIGAWDAHNVTEDADLGYRLYRRGYKTEILQSTTREEANCFPIRWIKQRSRWLKGYMVTYLVHMRQPARLHRELGTWPFLGFNAHFVSALSQFLLAPVFWCMWFIPFGLSHPLQRMTDEGLFQVFVYSFFTFEAFFALVSLIAVSGPAHRHLAPWVPSLMLYFPLGCLAAYKALFELVVMPFYWDKTQHGHSAPRPALSFRSSRSRRCRSSDG